MLFFIKIHIHGIAGFKLVLGIVGSYADFDDAVAVFELCSSGDRQDMAGIGFIGIAGGDDGHRCIGLDIADEFFLYLCADVDGVCVDEPHDLDAGLAQERAVLHTDIADDGAGQRADELVTAQVGFIIQLALVNGQLLTQRFIAAFLLGFVALVAAL